MSFLSEVQENIKSLKQTVTRVKKQDGSITYHGHPLADPATCEQLSTVVYISGESSELCQYCSENGRNFNFGILASSITLDTYDTLIQHNWRRSGNYFYRPLNDASCCPQYSTRLDVDLFKANKNQKKVLRRMDNYLKGAPNASNRNKSKNTSKCKSEQVLQLETELQQVVSIIFMSPGYIQYEYKGMINCTIRKKRKGSDVSNGNYYSNIAKALSGKYKIDANILADIICDRVKFCTTAIDGIIHVTVDEESSVNSRSTSETYTSEVRTEPDKNLEIVTGEALFDEESFNLFQKYQKEIHHNNNLTKENYISWLITSPIVTHDPAYGTYHTKFILDTILIGVAVWDILPSGLVGVYFFYDPDFRKVSLGIYCCLIEIKWLQNNRNKNCKYIYMGGYVPHCSKMMYKVR
eukprot:TRINITY_DN5958_c0_g1_i1.p1 TRINITY_DN5958_c0_g1~~TRINITY_DN5958_c0_g1_i1.p1  ORF type:complete len:409 (+),score=60.70 TRINITY_DN5958_c0_g1_i1:31-1257(+)